MTCKIYENVRVTDCGKFFELELGIHRAQMEEHPDIGMFSMLYEMEEAWIEIYYDAKEEGSVENALWEWFCSLSRLTNPNWTRILGRKDLAESF